MAARTAPPALARPRGSRAEGTQLRGADLTATDFYLVDLRGAQIDPPHVDYLRRRGAILDER